jgi:hypothetical protein
MKHHWLHIAGCLLPLLLIFLLPLFGGGEGVILFVFIVIMFGCHLLMMRGHGHGHGAEEADNSDTKGGHDAHSQH